MVAPPGEIPRAAPRVRAEHGEAREGHAGQRCFFFCFSKGGGIVVVIVGVVVVVFEGVGDAVPVARGEEGEFAGGVGIERLVRDAGGNEEDVAGVGAEFEAGGFFLVFVSVSVFLLALSAGDVVVVIILFIISSRVDIGDAEPDRRGAGEHGHAFVRRRMVVRRLGGRVAVDPLRVPPVAREASVDGGRVAGSVRLLVGEVVGVVDEGIGGVGDEGGGREVVASDVGLWHSFSFLFSIFLEFLWYLLFYFIWLGQLLRDGVHSRE